MGRFDNPPPRKSEKPSVPEWESFGEVEISELDGVGGQKMIDLARSLANSGGLEGKDIEHYANILNFCATVGGETPPVEWWMKAPFVTLKRLGDIALEVNGMGLKSEEKLEKN
jgi:hypothetical protein